MNIVQEACRDFAQRRDSKANPRYLFVQPRQAHAYLGLGCHQTITYRGGELEINRGGNCQRIACGNEVFAHIRHWLARELPSFWMLSPDINRATQDPDLPLILCVQPVSERKIECTATADPTPLPLPVAEGWQTEEDEAFLERLRSGITRLQDYLEGKMILTRPYQRPVGSRDPLRLFSLFGGSELAAAGSHYLQIDDRTVSLGCSPENVFEVIGGRLAFDVVAGTRGIAADPAKDALWLQALQSDPKEQREHLMALARYRKYIESLCTPGTVSEEYRLRVLQLGNVRHLYSRLSGQLDGQRDWLDLLAASMPALTSYPDELQTYADDQLAPLRYYGGIVGRVSPGANEARFYLNLRAALCKGDTLYTQGGVGVISQSEAAKELLEVKNKLRGLFKAVNLWESEDH